MLERQIVLNFGRHDRKMSQMAALQPLSPERRHAADYRDDIEHAEAAAALSELSDDHAARRAYLAGETTDSISLTRLLPDRPDLAKRLVDAHLAHTDRIWERHRGSAPLGPSATP